MKSPSISISRACLEKPYRSSEPCSRFTSNVVGSRCGSYSSRRSKGGGPGRFDPSLVKAIVRGQLWFEQLTRGRAESMSEIAKDEGVTPHYVSRLIALAFLAPDIVAAVFSGTQPVELTVEALTKHGDLPLDWAEQRALLGLDERS